MDEDKSEKSKKIVRKKGKTVTTSDSLKDEDEGEIKARFNKKRSQRSKIEAESKLRKRNQCAENRTKNMRLGYFLLIPY